MIELNKRPGQRVLELGGGENRNPASDVNIDVRMGKGVDFEVNLESDNWPIQSEEFDAVYAHFSLEHISFLKLPTTLKEVLRVLKPGGSLIAAVPNVKAQCEWIASHPDGWDGKDFFTSASELLFGSQNYSDNTHKCYWSPETAKALLEKAGFSEVKTQPYGDRSTDLAVMGVKAANPARPVVQRNTIPWENLPEDVVNAAMTQATEQKAATLAAIPREEAFDKHYFNGGRKVGGYANEGYRDFAVHEITARHILARKPESVLEIGPARGYILKRLQDAGVRACGLEISRHCWQTRVCNGIINFDVAKAPWPFRDQEFSHTVSVAALEHIPEEHIDTVLSEMRRVSRRGLHGIDFGHKDDGFDKTHCLLRSRAWWVEKFGKYFTLPEVEILDKEELERGEFPQEVLADGGLVKLNLGSHMVQFRHGWLNIDVHDLAGFAQANGYRYQQHDLRQGVPCQTGTVDAIVLSHVLEHFSYKDGLALLRDCRRALKPTGALRLAVPDAELLNRMYVDAITPTAPLARQLALADLAEMNDGVEAAPTPAGKLWALLHEGHASCYDWPTMKQTLEDSGMIPTNSGFRESIVHPMAERIRTEGFDMFPVISLFVDAIPKQG